MPAPVAISSRPVNALMIVDLPALYCPANTRTTVLSSERMVVGTLSASCCIFSLGADDSFLRERSSRSLPAAAHSSNSNFVEVMGISSALSHHVKPRELLCQSYSCFCNPVQVVEWHMSNVD